MSIVWILNDYWLNIDWILTEYWVITKSLKKLSIQHRSIIIYTNMNDIKGG